MAIPPQPPYRNLERSRSDRIVGGVCGGVAAYLNMDATLVRGLFVVLSLFTGVPVVLYLIALFAMPEEGATQSRQDYPPVTGTPTYNPYPYQPSQPYPYQTGEPAGDPFLAPAPGMQPPHSGPRQYGMPPASSDEALWGAGGAPWQQPPPAPPAPPVDPEGNGPTGSQRG